MTPPPVRLAAAGDLPALVALESVCFDDPWSAAQLAAEIRLPGSLVLVAVGDRVGDAAGGAPGYASFRFAIGEAELLRVAVAPGERRRGVARALLRFAYPRLAAAGAEVLHLEVERSNRSAVHLYQAEGFHRIGQRPGYYGQGRDALLYSRALPGPLHPLGQGAPA